MTTPWIALHHRLLGFLADTLTFLGAAALTRDAFRRTAEMKHRRIDEAFRARFQKLNLTDTEWEDALLSTYWAIAGSLLLLVGFFCQLLLRLAE